MKQTEQENTWSEDHARDRQLGAVSTVYRERSLTCHNYVLAEHFFNGLPNPAYHMHVQLKCYAPFVLDEL